MKSSCRRYSLATLAPLDSRFQTISSIEKDFANGYLFGEILYKFNQQSNFKEFSKKEDVASKLDNFAKLEVTFRNLKIKFDSKLVNAIMKEKRGEALRLLLQLRNTLEKVYPPTDIAVIRKTGKLGDQQPALRIANSKEKYDQHKHTFFKQRLQVLNKPQKQLNQEKHLQKFEDEKIRQEEDAKQFHKEQLEAQFKIKQEIRAASINKLQRNAGFMEEWLQKGVQDWKRNQTVKKDRERRELEFEYKQAQQFNNLTMRKIEESNKEVHEGIADFENTLKSKGINPYLKKDEASRVVEESLSNSPMKSQQKMTRMTQSLVTKGGPGFGITTQFGGMTLTTMGLKGKDKKTITDKTRKERERRRRKMIVDQSKTLFDMEQKRKEQQIVERMKRQAKQELELQYQEWRTQQCLGIIQENRNLREARYDKRKEIDQENANWRETMMIKSLEDQIGREMEVLKDRDREMRISKKQFKREGKADFASTLLEQIFEIADQAFVHQQQRDGDAIDPRNWHEWMQMFKDELPIRQASQEVALKVDHMEIVDYLTNQGQWPNTLVTECKLNIEQILTGQVEQPVAAGGKGKAPPKAQVEAIQLEEGDSEIPESAPNNFMLGDAVETLIQLNFEERARKKRPVIPHHLTLKVCLVGYQFAGKKTQAEKMKEEFGINTLLIGDLVLEAVQFFDSHPEPIEGVKYMNDTKQEEANEEQKEQIEDNSSEPGLEEANLNAEEDFRLCGMVIQQDLAAGEEICDELYVQLVVAKLRMTYPYKSKKELEAEVEDKVQQELSLRKQLEALERELSGEPIVDEVTGRRKKKRPQEQITQEKADLEQHLASLSQPERNGWVLIDFPTNFSQAKLLENALSGFVASEEEEMISRESELEKARLLAQGTEKEQPARQLERSGLDCVLWFDCDRDKCLNRAIGRRYDHMNEKMYHVQLQPPLTTNAPLCERLLPVDDEANCEQTLVDRWVAFDQHSNALERWLGKFGDEEKQRSLLAKVDANQGEEETFAQIKGVLGQIIAVKQERESLKKQEITQRIVEMEQAELEKARALEAEEEEKKKLEESGIEPEQKEEQKEESKVAKPEAAGEKVGPKPPGIENIDDDVKATLYQQWQSISNNYIEKMKKVFAGTREQRENMVGKLSEMQQQFLKFLHRADSKQDKLDQFIKDFNDFSDQYPDLREDEQTKEELHQRVDILSDELWEITEERKEQGIEERKKTMESGWIEFELGTVMNLAQSLMQCELDRFKGNVQLIHDYYHVFEDKLIPEAPQLNTADLVNEGEELPAVEVFAEGQDAFSIESYSYPRLDKLFERALKAQVVPDVTQQLAGGADKKGGAPKGKDPKKQAQEEEKPAEESQYVKEMKESIRVEKALLRFRLIQIREWAHAQLKEMRQATLHVYQKLEDWIHVATKAETDAIEEMSVVIKKAIEEESKIQDELRIKFMDFCVDQKIMNYIDPPPERLPAMEEIKPDRFTIPQLRNLVRELEKMAQDLGQFPQIPNKALVDYLVRKNQNSKTLGGEHSFPENWKQLTEYDFWSIVRNLDKQGQGCTNWKLLATYLVLLRSPLPLEKDAEQYSQALHDRGSKDLFITQEEFQAIPTWFDLSEYSQDREYSVHFPRVKLIKEILFQIHKEEKNGQIVLNGKKLISFLKAKEFLIFKRAVKSYEELIGIFQERN